MEQDKKIGSMHSEATSSVGLDNLALSDILSKCLDGDISKDAVLLISSHESPWCLVVIEEPPLRKQGSEGALSKCASSFCVATTRGERTIALLPSSEIDHFIDECIGKDAETCRIAISLPFNDVEGIPQQYGLVSYCLATGDHPYEVVSQKTALDYLKHIILDNINVCGLLHPALEKLRSYDRSNQADMLETLKAYLENDRNAQRCANLLYLHRNSLQYRVRRIQEIADIDLDDPNERAFLRLSLFLDS